MDEREYEKFTTYLEEITVVQTRLLIEKRQYQFRNHK